MRILRIGKAMLIGLILVILTPSLAVSEIRDSDITAAIQRRLSADEVAHYERINVEAKAGIVKLSGPVDNILAKEKAVEIARSTRGARSVIDMIHADTMERGDEEIYSDVVDALKRDTAVDYPDIAVGVKDGVVTLTGTVDSFAEKHLAGRVAKGVKGITEVKNKVLIEHKSERSDDEIKADIQGRFRDSVLIDHGFIKVQVRNGNVKLTGSVGNRYERLRASRMADLVSGAKSVDATELLTNMSQEDEMRHAWYRVAGSEAEVRNTIRDAFLYDPRVESSQIHIEVATPAATVDPVQMKAVTLTGTVDSPTAKWAAEEDAMNTVGVSRVENNLIAPLVASVSDSELLERVKKALLADPQLENFRLKMSVLNGEVRLSGIVDSHSNKQHTEDIVSGIKGVVNVQNDLKVESQQ